MFKGEKDTEKAAEEYIDYAERNKLLWSLRSEFAWEGKKIPESVEIEGQEYKLRDLIRNLGETELIDPEEAAEIRYLIPKLREKAKANEELLESEELTKKEAEMLYEEATGLLRAVMELEDKLEGKDGKEGPDEFKKMLKIQKLRDEKGWQDLIKGLK